MLQDKNIMRKAFLGVLVLGIYFLLPLFQSLPFQLLHINLDSIPTAIKAVYMLSYEILMVALVAFIFKDTLQEKLQDLKKNHKQYFKKYFKFWFLMLAIMMASNLIILLIDSNATAGNEDAIRDLFGKAPVYTYLSAVMIAPILEELVFRQSLRHIFSTNWIFILCSGLIFGGLHVIGNVTTWVDLLYLIPYCAPGFIFAYIMAKSDNVFVPMGIHFVHNGILMGLQVIVLLFS